MSEHSWKWFKHGWQYDCNALARSTNGALASVSIVVFTENKDKEEARAAARHELERYGYQNIDVRKIVPRF